MSQHLVAMKSLLFVLLLVQSSSSLTQGNNCSDTQLEAFRKQLDLSYSQVEYDCHMEVKERLIQISENDISTVKGPLVKYLRKFSHRTICISELLLSCYNSMLACTCTMINLAS